MAFKPSLSRKAAEGPEELDLTPYMNFVMILIPVIMQASEYIKLAMIPINLPPAPGASSASGPVEPEPVEETLDLAVAITSGGFTITAVDGGGLQRIRIRVVFVAQGKKFVSTT